MAASDVSSLLQLHGLQVDSITRLPRAELYNQCKLDDPQNIRLIRVFPCGLKPKNDGTEEALVAHMSSGPLSELKAQYEALSYVWGSGEKPKHITIVVMLPANRASMFECSITENLWQVLCDLRNTDQPRMLWIDALCINQDDIPEKNVQVAQMRDVYASANRTLAHLGPPFEGLDALVAYRECYETQTAWVGRPPAPGGQFMRFLPEHGIVRVNQTPYRILASVISMVLPYFYLRYGIALVASRSFAQITAMAFAVINAGFTLQLLLSQNKIFARKELDVLFNPDQLVYGLAEFFVRPWFRRAWVVQECVVSPKVCFLVGREEFDIEDVSRMAWGRRHLKALHAGTAPVSTHLLGFHRMLELRLARSEGGETPSLSTLLQWSWSYGLAEEASNPRDKIFALLGLIDDRDPDFFVDYALEPYEVFSRYGKILSQTAEGFMLLEDPRRHDISSMPSWVPDFSKTSQHSLYGVNDFYASSEGMPLAQYQLSANGVSLEVGAILLAGIDLIGAVYAPMPVELPEFHRIFLASSSKGSDTGPSIDFLQWMTFIKSYLELHGDIDEVLRGNYVLQLPEGLRTEAAAEVLLQVGVFFQQSAGSFAPASKSSLFQAEKYLDSEDAKEVIKKTVAATRYYRLYLEGLVSLKTPEGHNALEAEMNKFFTECSELPNVDRSLLFRRFAEHSYEYPVMGKQPLFRALSREEWPPKSMTNDESIPKEIYNDDWKLYQHFTISFSTPAGLGTWAERRLAKTPEGYLCNVDSETQLGDQIAIVTGCKMPLIVRPKKDGTYRVVGHAYVMGLMYVCCQDSAVVEKYGSPERGWPVPQRISAVDSEAGGAGTSMKVTLSAVNNMLDRTA